MLKRILKSAALLLSASVILAACGGMNDAQAQSLPNLFKSQTGVPFNVDTVESVEAKGSYLQTYGDARYSNGAIADGTGAVYAQLTGDPYFLSKYVRAGTTNRWLNTGKILLAQCKTTYTSIWWAGRAGTYTEVVDDGNCSTFYAIQAKAN